MATCQNCGNLIETGQTFCNNCGAKQMMEDQSRATRKHHFAGLNRWVWSILAAMILVIGLFITHTLLLNYYKPEKTVERFEKLVKANDFDGLRKILAQGGTDANLSIEELKGFTNFLTKEQDFKEIIVQLQQDATGIDHFQRLHPITDYNDNQLVMLVEGPKKFFLYPQYMIKAFPFTVTANSNFENTEVSFNGSSKLLKEPDQELEIYNGLPGSLTLQAVYKGAYVTLKKEAKVDFLKASDNTVNIPLHLDGKYVSLYSNGDVADIYANGKKTEAKIGDSFGPVPTNGSVKLYAVMSWQGKTIKSKVVKVDHEGEITLAFKEVADAKAKEEARERAFKSLATYAGSTPKQQMYDFMDEFLSMSVAAFNNRDFSMVSPFISPNGPGYNEMKNYIKDLEKRGILEEYGGVEILDMQTTDKGFKVRTKEVYDIYYDDGTSKEKTFESNYILVTSEFGLMEYQLVNTKVINEIDLGFTYPDGYDY